MAWGARMVMPTERAALTLAQWFSPAFPVGAFSFSHGLESPVLEGKINNSGALKIWLEALLTQGGGRTDVILLRAAFDADGQENRLDVNALAQALAPSKERLLETELQGAGFGKLMGAVNGFEMPALCYPVAVGWAAAQAELPLALTAQMYLQALASNLISAGIRLGCCGQTEGQQLLAYMADLCQSVANTAIRQTVNDLGSSCVALDIAAMNHETLYSRIFRS